VIARRLRLAFLDNAASREALPKIIAMMAQKLDWSAERIASERENAEVFLDTMLTRP
jgi:glycerol-3-phosphate dehydrogenase